LVADDFYNPNENKMTKPSLRLQR